MNAQEVTVESLEIRKQLLGEDHPQVAETLINLANVSSFLLLPFGLFLSVLYLPMRICVFGFETDDGAPACMPIKKACFVRAVVASL